MVIIDPSTTNGYFLASGIRGPDFELVAPRTVYNHLEVDLKAIFTARIRALVGCNGPVMLRKTPYISAPYREVDVKYTAYMKSACNMFGVFHFLNHAQEALYVLTENESIAIDEILMLNTFAASLLDNYLVDTSFRNLLEYGDEFKD